MVSGLGGPEFSVSYEKIAWYEIFTVKMKLFNNSRISYVKNAQKGKKNPCFCRNIGKNNSCG